ncbi:hypothetical protein RIF29_25068 [Crotalaria pallida]|uniref:CCHC-type domain-containing protein n=1 Tax=Crotalaria pallida TaxID=3830 RepID=A0AAN9EN40_CROPI
MLATTSSSSLPKSSCSSSFNYRDLLVLLLQTVFIRLLSPNAFLSKLKPNPNSADATTTIASLLPLSIRTPIRVLEFGLINVNAFLSSTFSTRFVHGVESPLAYHLLMDNRCETSNVNINKEDKNHVRDDNEDEFAELTPKQQRDQHTPKGGSVDDVSDLDVIKSKGAPKKKSSNRNTRKCFICNTVGHNQTTCPKRACAEDQPACNDHPSSSESLGDSSEYDHDVEGMSSDESLWKDNEPTSTKEPQLKDTRGSMSVSNESLSKVNEPMSSTEEGVKDSRGSMSVSNESLSKVNEQKSSTKEGVKESMKRKRSVNGGSLSTDMKPDSVTHFSNTVCKMKSTGPTDVAKKDHTVGVSHLTRQQNLYPYGIAPPYGLRPPYGIAPLYGIRPPYGIAPSWKGMPLYPYGIAPLHPQFTRVPVPNQHVSGASNVGDGTNNQLFRLDDVRIA